MIGRARVSLPGVSLTLLFASVATIFAQGPRLEPARAALVNGEAITLAEVDDIIKQQGPPLTAPTARQIRAMRVEVVTAMVDDLIIRQYLRANGPRIDPSEIEKQIVTLKQTLASQGKAFTAYLGELHQTEQQLRANLTLLHQLDRFVKQNTTEDDLKKYYASNKEYFDKITVRSSHIVIRYSADSTPAEREKAKTTLQAIRADVLSGKVDFARAAKDFSQCPSAPKGGDIGFILRKFQNVDEAYARTAFSMKVGEISDVVDTDYGCHLIKVTERTDPIPSKYEQCADEVRDAYSEELRVNLLKELRKKAKVEITLP
jgi:peptidyl-prolyl cis-trans isomerase C